MAVLTAFETLVDDASPYDVQAQIRYLADYLDSPGADDWRARLARVRFEVDPWVTQARSVREDLLGLDVDAKNTDKARRAEAGDLDRVLADAKTWLQWAAVAVARAARRPGGLGPRLMVRVDVGAVSKLTATAAHHKILRVLRALRDSRLELDEAQLERGERIAADLARELAEGTEVDASRHRLTVRREEVMDDAKELLRDLTLARDEVVALAGRDFPGLKLGILAAACARRGRRVPEEEDASQVATEPGVIPRAEANGPSDDGPFDDT